MVDEEMLQYVTEAVRDNYGFSDETAKRLVQYSCFAELLKWIPDYVCRFDCDYWAKKIVEDRWK